MQIARRPLRRASFLLGLFISLILPALGAERSRVQAQDYQIDVELYPQSHQISARARVKFTALDDTQFGSFELNNALRVTKVLDANAKPLSAERISQDNVIRVAFPSGLTKGASSTITFEYEGKLASAD